MDINIPSQLVVQTAAQWAADVVVYSAKRILITSDAFYGTTDQRKFKIADGVQTWAQLNYFPVSGFDDATSSIQTQLDGKQNSLGFTAEDVANKSTNVITDGASDVKYPSVKAVKTYADGLVAGLLDDRGSYDASVNTFPAAGGSGTAGAIMKGDIWYISVAGSLGGTPGQTATNWSVLETNIGYVPENVVNKSTDVNVDQASSTKYPTVKAVFDWASGLFATIANLALKAPLASPTFTGIPAAPTAAANNNSTQIATTAYVDTRVVTLDNMPDEVQLAVITSFRNLYNY